jgi:hypothetical protein
LELEIIVETHFLEVFVQGGATAQQDSGMRDGTLMVDGYGMTIHGKLKIISNTMKVALPAKQAPGLTRGTLALHVLHVQPVLLAMRGYHVEEQALEIVWDVRLAA